VDDIDGVGGFGFVTVGGVFDNHKHIFGFVWEIGRNYIDHHFCIFVGFVDLLEGVFEFPDFLLPVFDFHGLVGRVRGVTVKFERPMT
jgi:hypothetical protein